ncbi:CYIR protein [Plasmodium cynomolgi strain B]|uniref:CYIR protein n=1 Tax=Plasmodium cynomolgi (strain B) TaxID=1120755 RepID=K6VK76_PLACD|nr:CYIR protein [Plasmodium cynomolgi strain B]GAB69847.1 CYIR protein [Plasmodium cynomolgi strain B]
MIWKFIKNNLIVNMLKGKKVGASSNNIKLKKNIVIKWGIGTIVLCLIPLIGIILPILCKINIITDNTLQPILYSCDSFFITLTYIILFLIIYTMIIVVKYHRLEDGKGKMNKKLDSKTELNKLPDIKKKAHAFLVLTYCILFPLALSCIVLMVAGKFVFPSAPWIAWAIGVPAFIGFVLLSVLCATYYPFKKVKNIK